jgi:hypothetical protein
VVRFFENPLSFNHLNIFCADIPCVFGSGVGGSARSTQPVTLYITVDITPSALYNSPPSIPTADDGSHHPVEAGNNKPQGREEVSPASPEDLRPALDQADQALKRMDRSNTWQGAVGRVKWVMDTLRPIAEVRNTLLMAVADLTCTLSFSHSQRWRTVYF